ncbi:hypothetical protein L1887_44354 [Cichorium endivia]|nr:hypothetical protein L1887_44354 [Cichorium endivia]
MWRSTTSPTRSFCASSSRIAWEFKEALEAGLLPSMRRAPEAATGLLTRLCGDAWQLGVDVERDGELEELPLLDELAGGGALAALDQAELEEAVGEDDLCELDGDVVLVGGAILCDRGTDADGWGRRCTARCTLPGDRTRAADQGSSQSSSEMRLKRMATVCLKKPMWNTGRDELDVAVVADAVSHLEVAGFAERRGLRGLCLCAGQVRAQKDLGTVVRPGVRMMLCVHARRVRSTSLRELWRRGERGGQWAEPTTPKWRPEDSRRGRGDGDGVGSEACNADASSQRCSAFSKNFPALRRPPTLISKKWRSKSAEKERAGAKLAKLLKSDVSFRVPKATLSKRAVRYLALALPSVPSLTSITHHIMQEAETESLAESIRRFSLSDEPLSTSTAHSFVDAFAPLSHSAPPRAALVRSARRWPMSYSRNSSRLAALRSSRSPRAPSSATASSVSDKIRDENLPQLAHSRHSFQTCRHHAHTACSPRSTFWRALFSVIPTEAHDILIAEGILDLVLEASRCPATLSVAPHPIPTSSDHPSSPLQLRDDQLVSLAVAELISSAANSTVTRKFLAAQQALLGLARHRLRPSKYQLARDRFRLAPKNQCSRHPVRARRRQDLPRYRLRIRSRSVSVAIIPADLAAGPHPPKFSRIGQNVTRKDHSLFDAIRFELLSRTPGSEPSQKLESLDSGRSS